MSSSLPPIPTRSRAGAAPVPENPAQNTGQASSAGVEETEFLLVRLQHNFAEGTTVVSFEGQGFDATNDEIVVDILNTAASVFDYTLVADEDVTYVDEEGQ